MKSLAEAEAHERPTQRDNLLNRRFKVNDIRLTPGTPRHIAPIDRKEHR
jgi:hypothetical protein